jgi:spermidine/putrescine transport system substrate-binding protein
MVRSASRALAALALLVGTALPSSRPASAKDGRTLHLFTWSNYTVEDVLAEFQKEFDCTVDEKHYSSNDVLLAQLQSKATGFDVAVPSDIVLPVMAAQGLLEPIDRAKLKNLSHLDPTFLGREADPKDEWSVPYTWGTAGLAWRTDKLGEKVDSWDAFSDPRAHGQAYLLEEARDAVGAALLFSGHDVNATDPLSLADAKRTLLSWKPHLKGFTGEVRDTLESGEGWLVQAYNGDVAQARRTRKDIAYTVPKEGGIFWVDNLVIPKGAQQDLAYAYIDFVLRPEIAARISNGILYAVPNKDALEKVDPAIRADPSVYAPADVRARCKVEKDLGADSDRIANLWQEVRATDTSTNADRGGWLPWALVGVAGIFLAAFAIGWVRGRKSLG